MICWAGFHHIISGCPKTKVVLLIFAYSVWAPCGSWWRKQVDWRSDVSLQPQWQAHHEHYERRHCDVIVSSHSADVTGKTFYKHILIVWSHVLHYEWFIYALVYLCECQCDTATAFDNTLAHAPMILCQHFCLTPKLRHWVEVYIAAAEFCSADRLSSGSLWNAWCGVRFPLIEMTECQ